jgi:general secretion pathway protein I
VRARTAARGFTLIEVLVALAIVVIGMATIMGALTSSANSVSYLRDRTFGQWVALNQIANVRLAASIAHQQPSAGDSNGDTDFAGRSWHWRQLVTATEIPGVMRIDVSVRPAEVKGTDESGWFATVSGLWGDAVGTPNASIPSWGAPALGLPSGNPVNPLAPLNGIQNPSPRPNPNPNPPRGPGTQGGQ